MRDGSGRPQGGPPPKDFRNQNTYVLDDVRIRLGIPLGQEYGLVADPSIQPVFLVDPNAAPVQKLSGSALCNVGAGGAGNRSEVKVAASVLDRTIILECFIAIVGLTATANYEIVVGGSGTGFTQLPTPPFDDRLDWTQNAPGGMFIAFRNNAAATAGGRVVGNSIPVIAPCITPFIGPFYLDASRVNNPAGRTEIHVRPTADNLQVSCIITWKALQRQPT